ncbi:MAG: von Willebrand factor type A domain-containing protein [Crocinitomicaceae bacterium]
MKTINIFFSTTLMIFFLLIGNSSIAQAKTGTIKGVVIDQNNQKPIENAKVYIKDQRMTKTSVKTDKSGIFAFENVNAGSYYLYAELKGYEKYTRSTVKVEAGKTVELVIEMQPEIVKPEIVEEKEETSGDHAPVRTKTKKFFNSSHRSSAQGSVSQYYGVKDYNPNHNTESYNAIEENGYKAVKVSPLSTFSVDVDAASYSNVRRFILSGNKPDKGAVRVEEMINYFNYDYPDPTDEHPFSITTEVGDCPWNDNKLVHIGLQGKRMEKENLPNSNLVFLVDVSGSMNNSQKLPLLKKSFKLLVNELGENDKVSIVVYAGAAGLVLEPTTADNSTKIMEALDKLNAGGSTAGGAGIKLAYKVAKDNFIKGGNNRVILATDGDFNVGMSSDAAMQDLIVEQRKSGIFLTCLGFGTGNYKDSKMETLADKGNGNYAYIDNLLEAKKVLVTEIGATLNTIAKDVKIQVEFNPAIVESYRLVGYENRLLNDVDFNDDTKDAGEIGAGHSVTALYEIVLKGEGTGVETPDVDPLKYQTDKEVNTEFGDEMLTVKFRYKKPDGDKSILLSRSLENKISKESSWSNAYKFSAAVAQFGMLLRDSEYKGSASFESVMELASKGKGKDKNGYRHEFIQLVDAAKLIYK